jgi:alkanesulfonate monooxygenase SsuD/methylene tetrahydromethanopterin reductase-like flavin-dependent oxidoreductase (luciferase family)
MRFGLFASVAAPRGGPAGFLDHVELNVEAEALGFVSTFLVEHHFTGIGQVSAPLDVLAWIAARTTTLRVGTAVLVLPWHDPVLLAERTATLDQLSGGRLDLGVGKGYRHTEFAGFAIPPEEAEARFEEALEVLVRAWTSDERFSHHGACWRYDDVVVEPPPFQRPHPPLWIPASSPASVRRVAERGANLLLDQFASVEQVGERIAAFHAAGGGEVAVARNCYVARDRADADAALEVQAGMHARMIQLSGAATSHVKAYAEPESSALFGTPDDVATGLDGLRAVGVDHVLLNGGDDARASMRRFAEHVLPAFTDESRPVARST